MATFLARRSFIHHAKLKIIPKLLWNSNILKFQSSGITSGFQLSRSYDDDDNFKRSLPGPRDSYKLSHNEGWEDTNEELQRKIEALSPSKKIEVYSSLIKSLIRDCKEVHELIELFEHNSNVFNLSLHTYFLRQLLQLCRKSNASLGKSEEKSVIRKTMKVFNVNMSISELIFVLELLLICTKKYMFMNHVIQVLSHRAFEMNMRDFINFVYIFCHHHDITTHGHNLDAINLAVSLVAQKLLSPASIAELSTRDLMKVCWFCVKNNVVGLHFVFQEISQRNLDPYEVVSTLISALKVTQNAIRSLLLPKNSPFKLEVMTKKLLSSVASNIKDYRFPALSKILNCLIECKANNLSYLFDEELLNVISSASNLDLDLKDRITLSGHFYKLNYVNHNFIRETVDLMLEEPDMGDSIGHNFLFSVYFFDIEADKLERFLDIFHKLSVKDIKDVQLPKNINWTKTIMTYLEMGYFPTALLDIFYDRDFIEKYITSLCNGRPFEQTELSGIAQLNMYFKNRGISTYELPSGSTELIEKAVSDIVLAYYPVTRVRKHYSNLINFVGQENVLFGVLFNKMVILDCLIIVDENGILQPIASSYNDTSPIHFESLDIEENAQKLVLLDIAKGYNAKPLSTISFKKHLLESYGFKVILYKHKMDWDYKNSFQEAGVYL